MGFPYGNFNGGNLKYRIKIFSILITIVTFIFIFIFGYFIFIRQNNDLFNTDKTFELTVAHFNDTHAHLDATETLIGIKSKHFKQRFDFYAPLGGYPRLKYKFDQLRDIANKNHHPFLLLNGGDVFQGSLYFTQLHGVEEALLLSDMQIDAMVLGNHEFDLGNKVLKEFISRIDFPVLAANLNKSSSVVLRDIDNLKPFIIKDFAGTKVAIFGIVLEDMNGISAPDKDTQFLPEIETARKMIQHIEELGIHNIIMLSHIGLEKDQEIARTVNGIDLIVGSHSQTMLGDFTNLNLGSAFTNQKQAEDNSYAQLIQNPDGNKTCIVQNGEYALGYGLVHLAFDQNGHVMHCQGKNTLLSGDQFTHEYHSNIKEPLHLAELEYVKEFISEASNIEIVPEDLNMRAYIDHKLRPEVVALEKKMIAKVPKKMIHTRVPNPQASQVAPIVAEAIYWKLHALHMPVDFVIQNAGGVRSGINAGFISVGFIMGTLLPFGNKIVVFDLSGKDLKQTLEYVINAATGNSEELVSTGSFPYGGHLRYTYDAKASKGKRLSHIELLSLAQWIPIDDLKKYRIGTNYYVAMGKDGYFGFLNRNNLPHNGDFIDTGIGENEMFIDYVQKQKILNPLPYQAVEYKY